MTEPITRYRCSHCGVSLEDAEGGGPVYECGQDGARQVDDKQCGDCHRFMAKLSDLSCPDCEEPIEEWEEVEQWEAPDGTWHDSEEEADQWTADAPKRVEAAAAHKDWMDHTLAQHKAEREREWIEEAKPLLEALVPLLPEATAPELLRHVRWGIDHREAGIVLYLQFSEAARLLIPGPETELDLAFAEEHWDRYLDCRAVAERLKARMLETIAGLPGSALLEERFGYAYGLGTGLGFSTQELAPLLIAALSP